MEYYNTENKMPVRWAAIAVLIYFTLLALLMLSVRFAVATTDPATEGILVDFGESLDGFGDEELVATDTVATPPEAQVEEQEEQFDTDDNQDIEIAQHEIESIEKNPSPQTNEPIVERDTVIAEQRVVNQNALFPGRKEESSSSSQGNTQGAGNQGVVSGTQGDNNSGGGDGNEANVQLKDRSVVGELPKPSYTANTWGKVVIDITVDETGRVTGATYSSQGSTTNNSQLVEAARQAALKARFTPSDNFIQGGTITYTFKID